MYDLALLHARLFPAHENTAQRWHVYCRDGHIARLQPAHETPAPARAREDCNGAWLSPALIDCHTHLVHAGCRVGEARARLAGTDYAQQARAGGGILSTVRATRAADADTLLQQALVRLDALLAEGVGTVEIKSGYGLSLESERRMLQVARRLAEQRPVNVQTTFLAAHALPPEFAGRADDYIDTLAGQWLPQLAEEGLVDAVDIFCEHIGFSVEQARRLWRAAERLGLPIRVHAEQLSRTGAAVAAAEHGALSADHLEYLRESDCHILARHGTVAVLLPGAWHHLHETRKPPVGTLRQAGVPMAVASDCNPGSSPFASLRWNMNLACHHFGLTPDEVLAGVSEQAARALGLNDRGRIAPGQRADLLLWQLDDPHQLVLEMGTTRLLRRWHAAREVGP